MLPGHREPEYFESLDDDVAEIEMIFPNPVKKPVPKPLAEGFEAIGPEKAHPGPRTLGDIYAKADNGHHTPCTANQENKYAAEMTIHKMGLSAATPADKDILDRMDMSTESMVGAFAPNFPECPRKDVGDSATILFRPPQINHVERDRPADATYRNPLIMNRHAAGTSCMLR